MNRTVHFEKSILDHPRSMLCDTKVEPDAIGGAAEDDYQYAPDVFELASLSSGQTYGDTESYHDDKPHNLQLTIDSAPRTETVEPHNGDEGLPEVSADRLEMSPDRPRMDTRRRAYNPKNSYRSLLWDEPTTRTTNIPSPRSRFASEAADHLALCGCKVEMDGSVYDTEGNCTGEIVEGLPWILEKRFVHAGGEIFDDSGDRLGRAAPLPRLRNLTLLNDAKVSNVRHETIGKLGEYNDTPFDKVYVHSDGNIYDENDACCGRLNLFRARGLTPQELALMPALKGLELHSDGKVYDRRHAPVAYLIKGDAKPLKGMCIGTDGSLVVDKKSATYDPRIPYKYYVVAPLPAAQRANEFSCIKDMRVQCDGRVRNKEGKVVARRVEMDEGSGDGSRSESESGNGSRSEGGNESDSDVESIIERDLKHYRLYKIADRGEIVDDEDKFVGVADLVDIDGHTSDSGCPPNCFDCISKKFESVSYDQQIDLLGECMGLDWQLWPNPSTTPRIGMYAFSRQQGLSHTVFSKERTSDERDKLLDEFHDALENEEIDKFICVVESIDRRLAQRLGRLFDIELDFFFGHCKAHSGKVVGDEGVRHQISYGMKWGTIEGYFQQTNKRMERQLTERISKSHLSKPLSYYWANEQILLLLFDAPSEQNQVDDEEIASGEWRFYDPIFAFDGTPIPSTCDGLPCDFFRVMQRVFTSDCQLICDLFDSQAREKRDGLYPELLFVISIAAFRANLADLEDDVKRVSFGKILKPSREINAELHAQREDVHYIKAKLNELQILLSRYDTSQITPGNLWLGTKHTDDIKKALEVVTRVNQLLMETFQLLISTLTAEDNHRNYDHSRKANRITALAFIYAPLSFVTGIFGMNLNSVNDSPLPYWVCIIAGAVVGLLTGGFWLIHYVLGKRKDKQEEAMRKNPEKMA